uniref:Uncharacterized protein n=1 Tax=viral metagenome TaxID=1070528 RepID=A0A6M3LZT5_9ZZZZ
MTKNISWEEEFDDRFYRLLSTKYKPHEFVTEEVRQFIREVRKQAIEEFAEYIAKNISPEGGRLFLKKTEEYLEELDKS